MRYDANRMVGRRHTGRANGRHSFGGRSFGRTNSGDAAASAAKDKRPGSL